MGMYPISAKEWMVLAEENGYHPTVKQYIQENPEKLFQPMEGIYPRGWEYVSDLLNAYSKSAIVRNMEKVKVAVKEAIGGEAEELLKLYLQSENKQETETDGE